MLGFIRGRLLAAGAVALICLSDAKVLAEASDSNEVSVGSATNSTAKLTQLSLEELAAVKVDKVYGASKHEQLISEAPSSVTIVTADDFKKFGYRTLADALRSVRGMYVTYDRIYDYIGIRGVNRPGDYGGRVLITINGHRLNDPIYDQAFNGTEFLLDVDLIERVEVIRGPGSSLYGNNAFFAVVNVITRTGNAFKGVEASGSVASYDAYTGRLSYGNRFENGVELLLSGTWFESEGHERLQDPNFRAFNNGIADHLDGDRAPSVWASLSYGDFSLEGGYVDRRKEIPNAPYDILFDVRPAWQEDARGFAGLKFQHEFENDWQVLTRLFYDYYHSDLFAPFDGADLNLPGQTVFNHDVGTANWLDGEVQLTKRLFEQHLLTLGGEFRYDLELRQRSFDVAPSLVTADVKSHNDNFGLYAQDEFSIRTNLILNAGVRLDYFESFGDTVNPRAAIIYSPLDDMTFKLIYGQAFRAPNAYERDYRFPGYLPNPGLRPEHINSYEAVWEQGLGEHFRVTGDLFYNDIHDLITQVFDPALNSFIFRNTDKVQASGAELELDGHWADGLRGWASYTFVEAYEEGDGFSRRRLRDSPKHLAKFGLSVPFWQQKVFGSLEVQTASRRLTIADSVSGFVTLNGTLFSREILPGLEASISIYNLLDARFRDPVAPDFVQDSVLQDGRTFRAKLTYRF
jgi:outer membrane receptor for ferrienterochelin and colicins